MKFDKVLDLAKVAIEEFIALLEKETVFNSLNRRVIVESNETAKLDRLRLLFTSDLSPETASSLYLNQQIDQMIELKDPILGSLDFTLAPIDSLIIPITPLTLVYHSKLSKSQILTFLRSLQLFLDKKSNQLLCGWELTRLNEYDYYTNTATGIDWAFFRPFVKSTTPDGEKDSLLFNMAIEGHAYDTIQCFLTPKQFVTLQKTNGLNSQAEIVCAQNLVEFITPQQTDTSRLTTIKKMLTPKDGKKDFVVICQTIHSILSKRPQEGLSETETLFYNNLGRIYNPVRRIVEINSEIPVEEKPNSAETLKPEGNKNPTTNSATKLDHSSLSLSKKLLQSLSNIELHAVLLQETLLTLPTLTDPFKAEDEKLICELLHSKAPLFQELKKLATDKSFTIEDQTHLVSWLMSSMHLLTELIEQFSALHFRLSTLELSTYLIELLMSLRSDCGSKESDYLNNQIHLLKEDLLNACLFSGHYERVLSWLAIFATIPCTFSENTAFPFYYSRGQDLHFRSQVAHLTGDFETASELGNQTKDVIEQAFSLLLTQYGKKQKTSKQRAQPQIQYDPAIATDFLNATKKYIKCYALSHSALSTELFQFNRFLEAYESLKIVANDLENSKTYLEILDRIRSKFNLKFDSKSKQKKSTTSHELTTQKMRWCMVRNFLLIKRVLRSHLPPHFDLIENNETLVLLANKETQATALFAKLKKYSVTCTIDKKSINFTSFTTIQLDNLKKVLLSPPEKPSLHKIVPSSNKTEIGHEALRFRCLKNLHYKFFEHQKKAVFDVLDDELQVFYNQCKNPLLRMKTLLILVSLNLSSSFSSWASGQYQDAEDFFTSANTHSNTACQLLSNLSNNEHFAEASQICSIIKDKIESHIEVTTQVLFTSFLNSSSDYLNSVKPLLQGKISTFHWCHIGVNKMVTFFKNSEEIREVLFRKTLCFESKDYEKRHQLLVESTQLSFEAAYELLTQTALTKAEGNSPKIALERAQSAYKNLCDLKDQSGISLPAHIRSYIFVLKTIFESDLNLNQVLDHLNEALKIVNSNTNVAHKIEVILRKMDWISNGKIDSKIMRIIDELNQLFKLLRSLTTERAKSFSNQIMIAITRYFFLFFSYSLPFTDILSPTLQHDALELHELIQSIITYLEDTILVKDGSEFAISSLDNINTLKMIVKIRMLLISHSNLETKIRGDLVQKSDYSEGIQLLIPKMTITFSELLRHDDLLITPHSPLISLAITCQHMLSYSTAEQHNTNPEIQNLVSCYKTVSELTINIFPVLLQDQFKPFCEPNEDALSGFRQLILLTDCLNNAHLAYGLTISPDHLPLIRKMRDRFPNNIYIGYTLFRALSENNPRDTPCPEAIEACCKAADAGHSHAQYYYSVILVRGDFGATIDRDRAQDYLQKSNKQGYYRAQIRLAKLHKSGLFGRSEYNNEAAQLHAEAAMDNSETPDQARQELAAKFDVYFVPNQLH